MDMDDDEHRGGQAGTDAHQGLQGSAQAAHTHAQLPGERGEEQTQYGVGQAALELASSGVTACRGETGESRFPFCALDLGSHVSH